MHFGAPLYLLTLLAVPALAAAAAVARRRRSRYPIVFTNLDVLASVAPSRTPRRALVPLLLLLVALAVAASAAARPSVTVTTTRTHAVVVLLVDVSGSMEATDVAPNRITAAVAAMRTFIAKVPSQAEVGLVEFSTEPEVIETPTSDHDEVAGALQLLAPEGATALGDGIGTAVGVVRRALRAEGWRKRPSGDVPGAIVLLSDGAQNRGTLNPMQAAALARAAGIRVYTIAFGTAKGRMRVEGLPAAIPVPPDPATMREIAQDTGGRMYNARTADEAASVYGTLGSMIARTTERYNLTSWFTLGAVVLLLAALGSGQRLAPALP